MVTGIKTNPDGSTEGLDPRKMPVEELKSLGHVYHPPLRTMRLNCIDCSGGNAVEAGKCTATKCILWPYRMGTNPFREKRPLTPAQQANVANLVKLTKEKKR